MSIEDKNKILDASKRMRHKSLELQLRFLEGLIGFCVIGVIILLVFLGAAFGQYDMQDERVIGDKEFITTDDIYRDYGHEANNIGENTTGFVWDAGGTIEVHPVYIEDERNLVEIYGTCWHENQHLKIDGDREHEHDVIYGTPWWKKVDLRCGRWALTSIEGVSLNERLLPW